MFPTPRVLSSHTRKATISNTVKRTRTRETRTVLIVPRPLRRASPPSPRTRPRPPRGRASPRASDRQSHRGRPQHSRPPGRQQHRNRENKRRTTAKTKILLLSNSSSLKLKSMIMGLRVWIMITIMISWCLSMKDSSNCPKPSLPPPPQLRKTKRVSKSSPISTKTANRRQRQRLDPLRLPLLSRNRRLIKPSH